MYLVPRGKLQHHPLIYLLPREFVVFSSIIRFYCFLPLDRPKIGGKQLGHPIRRTPVGLLRLLHVLLVLLKQVCTHALPWGICGPDPLFLSSLFFILFIPLSWNVLAYFENGFY